MRRNRLVGIFPGLFWCFNTGGLGCALSLKNASFPLHAPIFRQNFQSHRGYFLTVRQPSVSLLLIGARGGWKQSP